MTATTSASMSPSVGNQQPWRRRDIQGLRAIAVLAVIAFHAELPIPGGFTGVDVFFVVSGFVITSLLARQRSAGTFTFTGFYARRAQRLLPALALMTVVVFLASLLFQSPFGAQEETASTGIGAVLLIANIVITRSLGSYFSPEAEANPLLHTWSLSVEEQFYLVFPVLVIGAMTVAAARQRRILRHLPIVLVGLLTIVSFSVSVAWSLGFATFELTSQPATWAFFLSPSRAWEFGAGALVALTTASGTWRPHATWALLLSLVGSALLGVSFFGISEGTTFPGIAALLPVSGTAALIISGRSVNHVTSILSCRAMVRIGDWSYSLYLWHWPFIVFATLLWPKPWVPVLAAALSFVPAVVSFYGVENPIRCRNISKAKIAFGSVAVSLGVVAAGVGLWRAGEALLPGISVLNEQRQILPIAQQRGCFLPDHFDQGAVRQLKQDCWFRAEGAKGWIMLAGDSHAAHASDGVVKAAHALDLDVFSVTGGACPYSTESVVASDVDNCDELNSFLTSQLVSGEPPIAVILGSKGVPAGADETLDVLAAKGIPVIWLRTVPRWAPPSQGIQHLPCSGGIVNFTCDFDSDVVEGFNQSTRTSEDDLLKRYPNVLGIDVSDRYCTSLFCSPIRDGLLEYRDNEHLNGIGSRAFADPLRVALTPLVADRPGS